MRKEDKRFWDGIKYANRVVRGYMDKVDFDHELGCASGGNRVFPSQKDLERNRPCVDECGIVEVEVRLRRIIRDTQGPR